MPTRSSLQASQSDQDPAVQAPIPVDPEGPTNNEASLARPRRENALLRKTEVPNTESEESVVPPPAYGEIYGQIQSEKNGIGTSARVADDGRVNIQINQLNRRLSQIFTPALRQQLENVEDSAPPPVPYIPPGLGGEEGGLPPLRLNVVIQVVGSRGDVQPFVALAKVLKNTYGHRVRLATHPTFKDFVEENGLEFFSIGGDPSKLMAFMVNNPSLMPRFSSLARGDVSDRIRDVGEYIQGCWRSCYQAGNGMEDEVANDAESESEARPFVADCIIANPPSFAHIHCAEKLGIPLHVMFTMPYSPSQAFPHPLANIQSSNADPQLTNYMSYAMIEVLSWQGLGEIINRFRKKCLGLDPVSLIWAPGMLQRLKIPHTYFWSPALIPKPKDWGAHITISGYCFLDQATSYTPSVELQAFLDQGPAPVYIGFGSIVLKDPHAMTELIFDAVRKTGQRVLLSQGWAGMGDGEVSVPDDVFMLGNVPHDWLFKHVSCVVHHGGAGTTAAGITAGRPTLVVPFFGDQYFWGTVTARAGAGPNPIPHKQLTADKLADAINFCLRPETLERAKELASKIAAERGTDVAAQLFHQFLEPDRLRCRLAPSRSATWRIKGTKVRLSAFAACTLANANLLNFNDLKLFKPQKYCTDEGPWDPISGFGTATFGVFSSMVAGLADIPAETWRAVKLPVSSSRQQSRASKTAVASKHGSSKVGSSSTLPKLPEPSQTNINEHESLARVRTTSALSRQSSVDSIVESIEPDALPTHSRPSQDDARQSQTHSRVKSSSGKERDMLRPTGVHVSRGFGQMVRTTFQAPVDMSVGITKGFHNAPKLWGDDTVRPQPQVKDLKTGFTAVGKEFGFGMYDGITGLATQPWRGARKEGVGGFFKGFGKGIGGFVTKPGAALFAIPSYFMKGVHKEVQKAFGSSVKSYIVASRTAQGYEEWLQSSDAEKQDVIDRWKLIETFVKKSRNRDEMMQDVLDTQRKTNAEGRNIDQGRGNASSPAQFVSADAGTLDSESAVLTMNVSRSSEDSLEEGRLNGNNRLSTQVTSLSNAREGPRAEDHHEDQVNLRHSMSAGQGEQVTVISWSGQGENSGTNQQASETNVDVERETGRHVRRKPVKRRRTPQELSVLQPTPSYDEEHLVNSTPSELDALSPVQRETLYDEGHLEGTTRSEFDARPQGHRGEKTQQERTEEDIVLEYIKKQSLLEAHHQNRFRGRGPSTEEEADDDLQRALDLSLQGHGGRQGEASRS